MPHHIFPKRYYIFYKAFLQYDHVDIMVPIIHCQIYLPQFVQNFHQWKAYLLVFFVFLQIEKEEQSPGEPVLECNNVFITDTSSRIMLFTHFFIIKKSPTQFAFHFIFFQTNLLLPITFIYVIPYLLSIFIPFYFSQSTILI